MEPELRSGLGHLNQHSIFYPYPAYGRAQINHVPIGFFKSCEAPRILNISLFDILWTSTKQSYPPRVLLIFTHKLLWKNKNLKIPVGFSYRYLIEFCRKRNPLDFIFHISKWGANPSDFIFHIFKPEKNPLGFYLPQY